MEKVYCRVAGTCHIAENIDPNIYNVLKQGEKGASLLPVEVIKAEHKWEVAIWKEVAQAKPLLEMGTCGLQARNGFRSGS